MQHRQIRARGCPAADFLASLGAQPTRPVRLRKDCLELRRDPCNQNGGTDTGEGAVSARGPPPRCLSVRTGSSDGLVLQLTFRWRFLVVAKKKGLDRDSSLLLMQTPAPPTNRPSAYRADAPSPRSSRSIFLTSGTLKRCSFFREQETQFWVLVQEIARHEKHAA
jgi:hypothetical protein